MSQTWSTVLDVDGSPVRAVPADFTAAQQQFSKLAGDADHLVSQFKAIAEGRSSELVGESADALSKVTGDLSKEMAKVPDVYRQVAETFRSHAADLARLRQEADAALARARTRWERRESEQRTLATQRARAGQLDRQIRQMSSQANELAVHQETYLRREQSRVETSIRQSERRLDAANDDLATSRREYDRLRDDHIQLQKRTAERLRKQPLFGMANPNLLQQMWNSVGDWWEGIDWGAIMWALRDALDVLIAVAAVIALAALLVVALLFLIGAPFSGGLSLLAFMGTVLLILSIAKLATGVTIAATDASDGKGRKGLSGGAIWGDVADVGLSLLPGGVGRILKTLGKGKHLPKLLALTKYTASKSNGKVSLGLRTTRSGSRFSAKKTRNQGFWDPKTKGDVTADGLRSAGKPVPKRYTTKQRGDETIVEQLIPTRQTKGVLDGVVGAPDNIRNARGLSEDVRRLRDPKEARNDYRLCPAS